MAHSDKRTSRSSSFVVIPLEPHRSRPARGAASSEDTAAEAKAAAVELVLRLRFTIDVEVETAEERDAL